jgi:geranylgeranyl diphosphate synthase type II
MLTIFKEKIEEHLNHLIPSSSPFYSSLYAGGKYALLAPGKRIRPLLTLSAAEMLQKNSLNRALVPACAVELVHTYSLIHDDLPCMDDDDFRRGRPTLHRVYSEGHAVLVGDYLLTYAFEVIAQAPELTAEQKVALFKTLTQAAGGEGMVGGQIMDIERSPHVQQMHHQKTAALFCAAVAFGGIAASASSETMDLLRQFGLQFGQLFQMVDDLLDGDHPEGQEKAEIAASLHLRNALETLEKLPGNASCLKELTQFVFALKTHEK